MTEVSIPKVSVIIPTYNAQEFIRTTIESVLDQTFDDFEIIVIDDNSTDETRAILKSYAHENRLRVLYNSDNLGAGPTRNAGLAVAKGRYIAFLDADDLWSPDKLEVQIAAMETSMIGFSYTEYNLIDPDGFRLGDSGRLPRSTNYDSLLNGCVVQNSTVVLDFDMTGRDLRCPDTRRRQDFGLFLAALRRIPRAHLIQAQTPMCSYRMVPGSVSSRKFGNIRFQWEIYRQHEEIGFTRSAYHLARWFLYAAHKNARRRLQRMTTAKVTQ